MVQIHRNIMLPFRISLINLFIFAGCMAAPLSLERKLNISRSSSSDNGIELLFTEARIAEVDYHVTLFTMRLSSKPAGPVWFTLKSDDEEVAFPLQDNITFHEDDATTPQIVYVFADQVGDTVIRMNSSNSAIKPKKYKDRVKIVAVHSLLLQSINALIGWIYFFAWSVSFYPQIYENFKRKSVVGLNFDFLCYNITGFIAYSFFNGGLYYFSSIQELYFAKYSGTIIPVQPNDVFFAFHAVIVTSVTIIQCIIYERGGQKVSRVAKVLLSLMWAFILISLIPAAMKKITWLTYLDFFSYVKLAVTLIKYIPQALMNYRRKSTVGWSIGNVILDFTGGSLSLLQMFFLSYNHNQWNSIFGDLTKFGLGLFSILFDILFLTQHYVLYRDFEPYNENNEEDIHAFENPVRINSSDDEEDYKRKSNSVSI